MNNKFYESFNYLNNHPIFACYLSDDVSFSKFQDCLDISVVKVNPESASIDDNQNLNTKVEVWLEVEPYLKNGEKAHDYDLDCGGDTFEEAIIKLAELVKEHYTSDKEIALKKVIDNFY